MYFLNLGVKVLRVFTSKLGNSFNLVCGCLYLWDELKMIIFIALVTRLLSSQQDPQARPPMVRMDGYVQGGACGSASSLLDGVQAWAKIELSVVHIKGCVTWCNLPVSSNTAISQCKFQKQIMSLTPNPRPKFSQFLVSQLEKWSKGNILT